MPSHIDNPTLTLNHIMKCCAASEVGFELKLTSAVIATFCARRNLDMSEAALCRHLGANRDAAIAARIADICCSAAIVVPANSQFADKPCFRCKE
jgi:hypothetical protein|tara:strand:- start:566 stop:850 length:285 start_codon:yes stop_codon:yes gene_type:complete